MGGGPGRDADGQTARLRRVIIPDSGVWIDLLRNRITPQVGALHDLLANRSVVGVGDLILAEVLQGTRDERDFDLTLATLGAFEQVPIVDQRVAIEAARNYRRLRSLGITPRKTIDVLIATRCILGDIPLLFGDRDYLPFVEHLRLRPVLNPGGF